MKTLLAPLDARPNYNDLFWRVRDKSAAVYTATEEAVAKEIVGRIKNVIEHVEGHVDSVIFQFVPADGMRRQGLGLLEAVQTIARNDAELAKTSLGRATRIRFERSEPPEPELERPPEPAAAPPVVAATPVDLTTTFDAGVEVAAIFTWRRLRQSLAQHPELAEPICTIEAPRGMDPDAFLEAVAHEARRDPVPRGYKQVSFLPSPAVA